MKTAKKVATIAVSVLLWAIILLAALFAFTTLATRDDSRVASVAGFTPMIVQSESMEPTFNKGDLIIIRKCDPSKLKVGDIITFHTIIMNEYALNTHRIAKIEEVAGLRSYTTMGDNNDGLADTHIIGDSDIVGQYVGRVPGLGKVMSFLSGSVGFLLIIVLPMLAFFIYQVYHLISVGIKLKRAVAAETAAEDEEQVQKLRQETEAAEKARAEAEAALAEAKRLKEEAEAQLAAAKSDKPSDGGAEQ